MSEDLLVQWLLADKRQSEIKQKMDLLGEELGRAVNDAKLAAVEIEKEMSLTGEFEIKIEGELTDYKIYWTTPRESVKVINSDAVPDEFCKIERKPKLKEIGDFIRQEKSPPNWAMIEKGESKLTYKLIKKGSK